jgi:hypothetical protein
MTSYIALAVLLCVCAGVLWLKMNAAIRKMKMREQMQKQMQEQMQKEKYERLPIRRTLEKDVEYRDVDVGELVVDDVYTLRDTEGNGQTLFVDKITDSEVTFVSKIFSEADNFRVILIRDGEKLRDVKGRAITVSGTVKRKSTEEKGSEL